mmetsp:Transcript_49590/g.49966  ORF Transcript_49590/g.49966 Transcript_49590/m.49966 type:complete len:121 (-) Transcript_49590:395-757(-)
MEITRPAYPTRETCQYDPRRPCDDNEANNEADNVVEADDDEEYLDGNNASELNLPKPIVIVTESPHPPLQTKESDAPYPSLLPTPNRFPTRDSIYGPPSNRSITNSNNSARLHPRRTSSF